MRWWDLHDTGRKRLALGFAACAALVLISGCAAFRSNKLKESVSPNFDASKFGAIAVIAGNESRSGVGIMVQVRNRMQQAGANVVRRSGLWESEAGALNDVCVDSPEQKAVNGLLVVRWDRLTLLECQTKKVVLEIEGGYNGTEKMTDRLLNLLGVQAPAVDRRAPES